MDTTFILKIIYILFVGIVLPYLWEVPYYVFIIVNFISVLFAVINLERLLEERVRIRNHMRCALAIYTPIFIFSLVLTIFRILTPEMYIIIFVLLLLFLLLCVLLRKQALLPYLLLVSNMDYKRAKENAAILYKQRKTENTMCSVVYLSVLFVVSVVQYNFVYMDILKFNMLSIVPLLLVDLYAILCVDVAVRGNENNKGRFSFCAFFAVMLICAGLPFLTIGEDISIMVKARTIAEKEVDAYSVRIATLKMDYQSHDIKVSKTNAMEEDIDFLKNVTIPVLPVDYEIYYVDEIDRENVSGTTLLNEDKAISYITNGDEDDILDLVFYHEYAHVLFYHMHRYEKLQKEYDVLRVSDFKEEEWTNYYVSQYAMSTTLEDMCEEYAFYMSNEKYRSYIEKEQYKIHKQKIELIRKYLMEEYDYDFYKE